LGAGRWLLGKSGFSTSTQQLTPNPLFEPPFVQHEAAVAEACEAFVATHNESLAGLCDRRLVLREGKLSGA